MTFTADATDRGTPESAWLPHLDRAGLRALALPRVDRVVAVAPHPDDEVLGVGGLLRALHAAGTEVVIVAVTGGEGSHPEHPGTVVRARRRAEADAARQALGVAAEVVELDVPDGRVPDHEAAVGAALDARCRQGSLLLAPWAHDGHPDHEATGRAAVDAAGRTGATLLAYPVWAWHWARPDDGRLPLDTAVAFPLTATAGAAKRAAIAAFASQLEPRAGAAPDPVLGPEVVARFARPFEVLFPA